MKTVCCALVLLLVSATGRASIDDLVSNQSVVSMFEQVLRKGLYGLRDIESAAFVLRDDDGSYRCLAWPETAHFREAQYRGELPHGVVAIVHTHPFTMPFPSSRDRWTAAHFGLPIYAITRSSIYKADTSGRSVEIVRGKVWWTEPILRTPQICPYAPREGSVSIAAPPRSVPDLDLVEVCDNRFAIGISGGYGDCGCECSQQ